MVFETDKQTMEDLNVFGRYGENSLFAIFNRCASQGGAALLEQIFRNPLADHELINRRSALIKFFAKHNLEMPVSGPQLDVIELYLSNSDERSKLSSNTKSLVLKLGNLLAPEIELMTIYKGIQELCNVFKSMHIFLNTPLLTMAEEFNDERLAMLDILTDPDFRSIISLDPKRKFTQEDYIYCDSLLRFRNRNSINKLLNHIYRLDVYITAANVALERNFSFAQAVDSSERILRIEGLYHPAVPKAVKNNIEIVKEHNIVFLTGANMAGKSTFMKSVSLAVYMAHLGFPAAVSSMKFSVLDGMFTTINLSDNIEIGASHFYAEVLRLKKVAQQLKDGKQIFIVFDELFRGTNVKDAYEATVAVVQAFASRTQSLLVISTHIIEAGDELKKTCNNIRYLYMPTQMKDDKPIYSYKVSEGITEDRHGMVILNRENIIGILESGINSKKIKLSHEF